MMSVSSTNAFLHPSPPPTTNFLPRSQRTRLLKSSRKLQAVLGTTPFVLEVDVSPSFLDFDIDPAAGSSSSTVNSTRPPITPRTRARRRCGRLFETSDSSSSSSSDDDEEEKDRNRFEDGNVSEGSYVVISSATPEGAYQSHSIPAAVALSPSPAPTSKTRHSSKSEANKKSSKYNKSKPLPHAPSIPIHLDLPLSRSMKVANAKGPQQLAQPLLFRLRSVPVPSHSVGSGHTKSTSISSITSTEPRSPLSSMFNFSSATNGSDAADATQDTREKEMKRKKMAKLTRTLGENVPPELVFPLSSATSPASATLENSPLMKASVKSKPRKSSIERVDVALSANDTPSSYESKTSSSTFTPKVDSKSHVKTPSSMTISPSKRKHRPRSLSAPLVFPIVFPTTPEYSTTQTVDHDGSQTRSAPVQGRQVQSRTLNLGHIHAQSHAGIRARNQVQTVSYRPRAGASLDSPRAVAVFSNFIPASAVGSSTSLTVGGAYASRGAASLDIVRSRAKSPVDYVYGMSSANGSVILDGDLSETRRKEREWSGEWNLHDMGDVVKKLRELKGK